MKRVNGLRIDIQDSSPAFFPGAVGERKERGRRGDRGGYPVFIAEGTSVGSDGR